MITIRSAIFFIILVTFTPVYALLCLISFPFLSHHWRYQMVLGWNFSILFFLRHICQITYELRGLKNAMAVKDQPVVVLSKHQSAWETISLLAILPKQLCFVFKQELLWIPFFGWVLGMLRMIHINRSKSTNAALSVTTQGKKYLNQGLWILIFPEGTRTPVGSTMPYKKGGARLASATQAWVLPIAHNAGRVWPRNSFLKYPGKIIVSIGPAISSADITPGQLHETMESWIENEMRSIDSQAYKPN